MNEEMEAEMNKMDLTPRKKADLGKNVAACE